MTPKTPFIAHLTSKQVARFSNSNDAQEYGQFYSERHATTVEVEGPFGLIGQYKKGYPTPEFACRDDAWFPAGARVKA